VEIKKIRTATEFIKSQEGQKKGTAQMKPLKKIFHRAGAIREANINLQMMKDFNISHPAFKAEEKDLLQQESEQFRLHAVRYDNHFRKAVCNLLKTLRPIRNRNIKRWFSRQLRAIARFVVTPSTDKLHSARKKIKSLIYVHGMLHMRLATELKLNVDYLDQLQDVIGKWHDKAVAVELLIFRNVGSKATINKLKKERDQAGDVIYVISDDFWGKVFGASDTVSKTV
jgi:CHAD domain-containing protein